MSEILRIRSFDLAVAAFDAALAFYRNDWGLTVSLETESAVYLSATGGDHHVVALHRADHSRVLRFDLLAESPEAVRRIASRLAERGDLPVLETPAPIDEPGGGFGFSFLDFEGRTTRILFCPPRDAAPPDLDHPIALSHMLFNSAKREEMIALYVTSLGFREADQMFRSVFLSCGPSHHCIGFSASDKGSSLHHAAFDVKSIDAVMRGAGRLRHAGHGLAWGVGRHGPGDNVFAYFIGPGREIIEYTAEMQQIGPDHEPHDSAYWEAQHPPGWKDHWGIGDPSDEMVAARDAVPFGSASIFHADRGAAAA